jgi:hypothetical protein
VVHALAAARLDGSAPTEGEARLVAAVLGAPVSLPFSDLLAARQLAAVTALVPAGSGPVYEAVRAGALLLGVVTAVLLWAVLRRLGCGGPSAAVAVAIVGVTPPAVALHAGVTGATVAVPWLLLAALLTFGGRVRSVGAVVAAVAAVLTAPLVGAVLLAVAASWLADRGMVSTASRPGIGTGVGLGVAAVAVAAAASGAGPLAGEADLLITTPQAVTGAAAGAVVVAAGWLVRWVRPLLAPTALLLAVLLVPGPGRGSAALTVLPLVAAIVAALVDDVATRLPRVRPLLWSGAGAIVAAAALAAVALPAGPPLSEPAPASLQAWLADQLAPGAALHADALDRAELIAAGFPADRLRALGEPSAAADVVLLTDRPGGVEPPPRCPGTTLLTALPRWGGGPAELCSARVAPDADTDDASGRASRIRIGTALAGNPALHLDTRAAELLTTGQVDPRVMIALAALGGAHTVTVAEFPPAALEPPAALRRRVVVAAVDGEAATTDGPTALHDWLGRQRAPFAPSVLRDDGGGLLLGYRGPSPVGLLPD